MKRKCRPSAHDPIPKSVRPIIERVHQRYIALLPQERPAIDNPSVVATLLTLEERCDLARCGYYPIPMSVIRHGMTPAECQRQEFFAAVAEQLPDAVKVILESQLT